MITPFAGWSTNPNATSGTAEDALPTVSDNVTYYAVFTQTERIYTIHVDFGKYAEDGYTWNSLENLI